MSEVFRHLEGFSGVIYVPEGRLIAADPASLEWLQIEEWLAAEQAEEDEG